MKRKDINQLVLMSFTKNTLDETKVDNIAKLLNRKDLKLYIRGLVLEDKKHKIYIALPSKKLYNAKRKELEKLFSGKELIFQEDPSLLLGTRILDNDMLYELSLSEKLDKMTKGVIEHYSMYE